MGDLRSTVRLLVRGGAILVINLGLGLLPAQAAEARGTLTVVATVEPSAAFVVRSDGSLELVQANARPGDQVSGLSFVKVPVARPARESAKARTSTSAPGRQRATQK